MRERTEPGPRRALHDVLVAEIEDLTARIRELTALIEAPARPDNDLPSRTIAGPRSGAESAQT